MTKRDSMRRRDFLQAAGGVAAATLTPYWMSHEKAFAFEFAAKNDRPHIGQIGCGGQGNGITKSAKRFGEVVAVCDVDQQHAEQAKAAPGGGKAEIYGDYRKLLDRKDIDLVTIATPDHWHTKIAIDALKAGKDVYCEKPLTLTIDEGKLICKAVKETGRVFQVGTQQRSQDNNRFLIAVALCHAGRLGTLKKLTCSIGGGDRGGPFKETDPPPHLNWERWLGQAPLVPYIPQRCHYTFRWWYEYSGGKMTDWGAHHVDIATWAIGAGDAKPGEGGPTSIEGTAVHQNIKNGYNTAVEFLITCKYESGVEVVLRHDGENGVLIEGDKGRIFVSRGALKGKPVEELKENPLPEDAITKLYKGKKPGDHMANFFECIRTREQPISDVFTHHRALTTCHLANIAIRLGRPLKWDPAKEQIVGDEEANGWLAREQRKGYEITV
ncbi:MAG: Gfo/Idh/MocA family oxidoreductase [Pirellulales bacterium]